MRSGGEPSTNSAAAAGHGAAADFVRRFARAWANPTPAEFLELFDPRIRLIGPNQPTAVGLQQAGRNFRALLSAMPGLRVRVIDWAPHANGVFIYFEVQVNDRGELIRWPTIDRFLLKNGLATERLGLFDSLPVIRRLLRRPRLLAGCSRHGVRPRLPGCESPAQPACPPRERRGSDTDAARFAQQLEAVWSNPTPTAVGSLFHPDVRVNVPLVGKWEGNHDACARVARALSVPKDVRGTLVRWGTGQNGTALYAETQLLLSGGWLSDYRWTTLDRYELADGRIIRWDSFFDTPPILFELLKRPVLVRRWHAVRSLGV